MSKASSIAISSPRTSRYRPDGVVKVLDFGLAKALDPVSSPYVEVMNSPTFTSPAHMTRPGVILGTAAYMSPEQARGLVLDKRTDIWAFGCVLYETLTGRVPFKGATVSDTIVAILSGEPDWEALPDATPAGVRVLLQRCLEKDPKRRLRDIGDARIELDQPERRSGVIPAPTGQHDVRGSDTALASAPGARWRPVYIGGLALVLAGLVAAGLRFRSAATPAVPVTSASEYTQITNFTDSATAPSLSPDGRMVTFIRGGESFLSNGQIHVKLLPNGESVRLTNDAARKYAPVFTPDGSRIAYTRVAPEGWDTWSVPVLGGEPSRLLPNASGLTWITDRHVLFSEIKTGLHMGIVTATEGRADAREVYFQPNEHAMAHYSYASPNRQLVLVVEMLGTHAFDQPCRLIPFDGSSAGRQVGPRGTCTSAAWSPDGAWMYFGATVTPIASCCSLVPDTAGGQWRSKPSAEGGISGSLPLSTDT